MPSPIQAPHALTNTFSGVAGEARVAAELVRCGLKVAKPYWTDDSTDLLVLAESGTAVVPIPVQVKSVQFLPQKGGETPKHRHVQGLKKRYLDRPELCLAVYRPDTDTIWFVDGASNITAVYEAQKTWNTKHQPLTELDENVDVRLYVEADRGVPGDWTVPRNDRRWLAARIQKVADATADQNREIAALEAMWPTSDPVLDSEDEPDGDDVNDAATNAADRE